MKLRVVQLTGWYPAEHVSLLLISTDLECSYSCTFTHHFDSVTLSVLPNPHMGTSLSGARMAQIFQSYQSEVLAHLGLLCLCLLYCECFSCHRLIVLVWCLCLQGPIEDSYGCSSTNDIADWSHLAC